VGGAINGLASEEADDSHSPSSVSATSSRQNAREEAEKLPLVKQAIEVLGASVQRVDEGFGVLPIAPPKPEEAPVEEES
jgi:hypothetical protein